MNTTNPSVFVAGCSYWRNGSGGRVTMTVTGREGDRVQGVVDGKNIDRKVHTGRDGGEYVLMGSSVANIFLAERKV